MRKSKLGIRAGELRQHERYELIDFALLEGSPDGDPTRCVIVNVSLGGLQIRSRLPLPLGSQCWLRIPKLEGAPVRVRGTVRHSARVPNTELMASGFRFTPATHEERKTISAYIHEVFLRRADALSG